MRLARLASLLLFVSAILAQTGCDRAGKPILTSGKAAKENEPSAKDMQTAREVLTIPEVLAMLRANVPNDKIIAEVKRRHIPQVLVEAGKLELAANGANHLLLETLQDPKNTLTESQDKAYSIVLTEQFKSKKAPAKAR